MPQNSEIKARLKNLNKTVDIAGKISDSPPQTIIQDDTFFHCKSGRLKLRCFPDGHAELIYYRREDASGPKTSTYQILPVSAPDKMRELLGQAYGVAGRVKKRRILYLSGRTRIHLDSVEQLGDFIELEVVLHEGENPETGQLEVLELMNRLGIRKSDLVSGAYVDLLNDAKGRT